MSVDAILLALSLVAILIVAIWLRNTDYAVGCVRYREEGCANPSRRKCTFPDCGRSRDYKPKRPIVW